jgi:gamma-tubulin complex component 2
LRFDIGRNQQTQELLFFLQTKAAVPFFEMLESWIYKGIIHDPYGEFFVQEHGEVQKEDLNEYYDHKYFWYCLYLSFSYWESRYTVNETNVPQYLAAVCTRTLVAGF